MKKHSRSFFGQKSGFIFDSGDWSQEYIYITFLKKLDNGNWEKPSEKQGKKIKLNLGEILMIRRVLTNIDERWSTVHNFNEEQTSIAISRDKKEMDQYWFNVDDYKKNIRSPETEILILILNHVIGEKIEHATGLSQEYSKDTNSEEKTITKPKNNIEYHNEIKEDIKTEPKNFYCKTFSH